jgi:hypothetical protein
MKLARNDDFLVFFEIHQNVTTTFNVVPSLPFPLYLSPTFQTMLSMSMTMTIALLYGLYLRAVIFAYLFRELTFECKLKQEQV